MADGGMVDFQSKTVKPIEVYVRPDGSRVLTACIYMDRKFLCSDTFLTAVLRTLGYVHTMTMHWKEGRAYVEFDDVLPCLIVTAQYLGR